MNYTEHEFIPIKEFVKGGSRLTEQALYRLAIIVEGQENMKAVFNRHGNRVYVYPKNLNNLLNCLESKNILTRSRGIKLVGTKHFLEKYDPKEIYLSKEIPKNSPTEEDGCKTRFINCCPLPLGRVKSCIAIFESDLMAYYEVSQEARKAIGKILLNDELKDDAKFQCL